MEENKNSNTLSKKSYRFSVNLPQEVGKWIKNKMKNQKYGWFNRWVVMKVLREIKEEKRYYLKEDFRMRDMFTKEHRKMIEEQMEHI